MTRVMVEVETGREVMDRVGAAEKVGAKAPAASARAEAEAGDRGGGAATGQAMEEVVSMAATAVEE